MEYPKLVVLYSTQYRTWNNTCHNHIELIRHLGGSENNCIFGIHLWNTDAPDILPEPIQKFPHKYTRTEQNIQHTPIDLEYYAARYKIRSIIESTKIALDNAKQLYRELYNAEMPDDQLILRLRPDAYIDDISHFPYFPHKIYGNNLYVSMWNSNHRSYIKNAPETSDLLGLTTKKTMELFTNIDMNNLEHIINTYRNKGHTVDSIEQILYSLLDNIGAHIENVYSLKLGIFRHNMHIERLTY